MNSRFRQILLLLVFLSSMHTLIAQQNKMDIAGVYFLKGVMETASVFELKPDSGFEFFFSQGALDRGGKGKWTVREGKLVLNSIGTRPAKDYALLSSKAIPGNTTVIKMVDRNTMILSYSDVTLKTPSGILQKSTDSHGEITFPQKNATEIGLLFRLCPDRESVFALNKDHNYFEFRLEPWIAEVFFQDFTLQIAGKGLIGKHPLLDGNTFHYERE